MDVSSLKHLSPHEALKHLSPHEAMGKITVIFNNTEDDKRLKTGWGSSMLVEQDGESILFDTGPDAFDLFFNLDILGIDRKNIQHIAISHRHRDHTGALAPILHENPKAIELYVPPQFGEKAENLLPLSKNIYVVDERKEIAKGVYIKAIKGLFTKENVLVIDTPRGLILLTGCGHPGIHRIFRRVREDFGKNIYAALGGFHFEHCPSFFVKILGNSLKRLGVALIGPNHCTPERAIKVLRGIFKGDFLSFGCGSSFIFNLL